MGQRVSGGNQKYMKRCQQLLALSREHQDSLLIADKIALLAEEGSKASLAEGIELLKKYNKTELEKHFQHEEQTIFAPLIQQHQEHIKLCISLGREHGLMRTIIEDITFATAKRDLANFAHILKRHSLIEESELFPIVEIVFTEEQLDTVLNFEPWLPLYSKVG